MSADPRCTCPPVMTPAHPRWDEFVDRVTEALAGPLCGAESLTVVALGVRAVAAEDSALIIRAAVRGCSSKYRGMEAHATCRAVLATMELDVEASLAFFREHGGYCDCEVMLNVAANLEAETEDA